MEPYENGKPCIGQDQYSKFVDGRLSIDAMTVTDPFPKNKLPLFSRPAVKAPSKGKIQRYAVSE